MEHYVEVFRENNQKLSRIKAVFSQCFALNKRYFYLSGKNLNIPNNIDNGVSLENFWELLTQHFKGEIRLGVSCETIVSSDKINFAAIDIDYPKMNMDEKYELACKLQSKIKEKLNLKSIIETSKSKGFHLFIFFSFPVNRNQIQAKLANIIEKDFKLNIKNGEIELFPKCDGISVIFLPCFGLLDKEGYIQESFFENKSNCLVDNKNMNVLENIADTMHEAINDTYQKQEETKGKNNELPCIEFAQHNWVEGNRQDLAMALSGVCRKKLNMTQDEAEDLILGIARNNADDEISQRKGAIKSTYKNDDLSKIKACSYFDKETICGDCTFCKPKEANENSTSPSKDSSKNILALLKSSEDIMKESDVEWVVKDLFAKKLVSILFSEPGVGKTVLAMDIAEKLTKGKAIFNSFKVERPMKVLYFQGDFPNNIVKERFSKMMSRPDDKYFRLVNRYEAEDSGASLGLTTISGQNNIKEIFKNYKPDFVIFDTFISFFDGDENAQKDVKGPIDFLRKITSSYDCSILLCHHSRKRSSNERRKGLDQSDLIGSFVTARLCSLLLAISNDAEKSTKEEKYNNVACAKTWFKTMEPFQFIISNNEDFLQVIYTTEEITPTGKNKTQLAKEKITQFLTGMPDVKFQTKQLLQIAGVSIRTLNTALSELLASGVLSAEGKTKDRVYFYDSSKKVEKKKPQEKIFIDEENSLI